MTTTVTLPADVETWAREEIAAGRAESVAGAVVEAVRESQELRAFRVSLDAAEAESGGVAADETFARLKARFAAP